MEKFYDILYYNVRVCSQFVLSIYIYTCVFTFTFLLGTICVTEKKFAEILYSCADMHVLKSNDM